MRASNPRGSRIYLIEREEEREDLCSVHEADEAVIKGEDTVKARSKSPSQTKNREITVAHFYHGVLSQVFFF